MPVEFLFETYPCPLTIPEPVVTGQFDAPVLTKSGRQYLLRNLEINNHLQFAEGRHHRASRRKPCRLYESTAGD